MSEQILYTKNSVLNYMLNRNISRCKEKGIDVKCMVTGSIDGIPDRDVYILAGNLFENAVEAACPGGKSVYQHYNLRKRYLSVF